MVDSRTREEPRACRRSGRSAAGGRRVQQAPPRRRPKRRHGILFKLYVFLVICSAIVVGLYIAHELLVQPPAIPQSETTAPDTEDTALPVADPEDPNALVRRDGVYNFVLLGKDVDGSNTDTIIVAQYDTVNQKVGMVSIPRDTAVQRTWSKYCKINAAFYGSGSDTLKQEIQDTFGIPIDYYILVDPKGFVALVDELEGVDLYIPEDMNYDDPTPGEELHIHYTAGQHHLTGSQALEVVRFRHNNDGSGYTDTGRAEMQRQLLLALAEKVLSWNSLTKMQSFLEIFQTYVKTDLTATDMLYFAEQALQLDLSADVRQGALTGRGDGVVGASKWCFVYEAEDILPTLNELVNPYTRDLTAEDLNLPVADRYMLSGG